MTNENRTTWNHQEDAKLTDLINKYSPKNWSKLANMLGNRNGKQCRERWYNHLTPNVNKSPLQEWEKEKILELQTKFGNKWTKISKELPGRTDNTVKNFYHSYKNRKEKKKSGKKRKNLSLINQIEINECKKMIEDDSMIYFSQCSINILAEICYICYKKYFTNEEIKESELKKYPGIEIIFQSSISE
ncbi:Myb-like transcription factor [Tubulinosema ratisbonensis]|uniref:Myb-like transcription factor n=1 Tax=Tubulinosema ratisbonensis TaxID=291195 RepID=A0A437AQI5_9MICR|nr:Myb-like transcription factor [Tubulinosema ratisbonensis]